ncbi:MAG: sialidase family protein [Planctomycetota bacterium]
MEPPIVLDLPHGPDHPRNSEGAFVTLADGRLLFAWSRYRGDDWADHAGADIVGRFSSDDGRTWSSDDTILVANEGDCNVMSASLLRLRDGRIGLFYLRKNNFLDCRLYMRTSADEARTWSDPSLCIPAPGYFVVNNDRVIQLSSGRLVAPAGFHRARLDSREMAHEVSDSRSIVLFFLSDDGGATWRESDDWLAFPGKCSSGLQEPGAVELTDGRIYAWSRTRAGCQYEMVSADGGDAWTLPQPSRFRSPCSPLCIKRLGTTGDLLAVWNDHSGHLAPVPPEAGPLRDVSWGRTPLVTAISRDDGATWTSHKLLESDPRRGFCYTAIHDVSDAVLLAYCCGGGDRGAVLQDLCVRRVRLGWFYG